MASMISSSVGGLVSGVGGLVAANNLPKNSYNAPLAPTTAGNVSALQALTPQQQSLTSQLLAQSQGQGPNPAQAMLNQATNRNIAQTSGMIASQQGISPALAARLGAQNAASANQTAAGQGALMGAQQQLAAQGLAANTMNQQQNTLNNAINNQYNTTGQINSGVSAQNNQNSVNAVSGALQGFSQFLGPSSGGGSSGGGGGGVMDAASSFLAKGGKVPRFDTGGGIPSWQSLMNNNPFLKKQSSTTSNDSSQNPNIGSPIAQTPTASYSAPDVTPGNTQSIGAGGGGLSESIGNVPMAPGTGGMAQVSWTGGKISNYDDGTQSVPDSDNTGRNPASVPSDDDESTTNSFLQAMGAAVAHPEAAVKKARQNKARGGAVKKVPAMVSPGEKYIPPHLVPKARQGNPLTVSVTFPGTPKVKGDNPKNDTLPVMLEPGGVVLPNSVTQAKNPEERARRFMAEIQKKAKGGKVDGFHAILLLKRKA